MTQGRRTRPTLGFVLALVVAYGACRAVSAVVLLLVAPYQEPTGWTGPSVTYLSFTQQWDAQWYQGIARDGYPRSLPMGDDGRVQQNAWAFYPLYPLTIRGLVQLTGADPVAVSAALSLVFGALAAVLLGLLLRRRLGPAAALLTVVVYASAPAAPIFQVAYTESMAMALLAGFLLAADTRRWASAGALALVLGITRPIAVPLAAVAVVAVVTRWRASRPQRAEAVTMLAMVAACGVAGLIWPATAALVTGSPTAYPDTMSAWRGSGEIVPVLPWLDNSRYFFGDAGPWLLAGSILLVVAMVAGPWAGGLGAVTRAWALAYPAYLLAVLDPGTSLVRYLLPMFPLAAVAIGVAGRSANTECGPPGRSEWRSPRWGTLVATVLVTAGCVLGQYLWTDGLWRFVPPTDWPP